MFYLLLNTTYTALRSFVSQVTLPPRKVGMHKKLGVGTAGTAGLNRLNGYNVLYNVMLSNKTGRTFRVTVFLPSQVIAMHNGACLNRTSACQWEIENKFQILLCLLVQPLLYLIILFIPPVYSFLAF